MTASIPRYVRIEYAPRGVFGFPFDRWVVRCVCVDAYHGVVYARRTHGEAVADADRHARACLAVHAAMERDHLTMRVGQLVAEREELIEGRYRLADLLAESRADVARLAATIDRLHTDLERCRNLSFALIGETVS